MCFHFCVLPWCFPWLLPVLTIGAPLRKAASTSQELVLFRINKHESIRR